MFKKAISVLLSIIIILSIVPMAYAASTASLYGIYGDGMLFQQNEKAIFAGTATSGAKVTAELYDSANTLVRKYSSYAKNGKFEVYFPAPAGSYEEYTVVLYVDGREFNRFENVVFGELWLASGQSNMAYTLKQETTGAKMYESGQKLSKWLRAFIVPSTPKYNGSADATPLEPQNDLLGAQWVTGEQEKIYSVSAVAYFFAETLQKKIDMPVGILHNSLGGSTINSWLSRSAIDRCPNVKSTYTAKGTYITEAAWSTTTPNRYQNMTSNYNVKIYPTRHFRPAGMIWYQGESDLFNKTLPKEYAEQLDLLQRSYSELFGYENNELMPLVCTQLAPFKYSTTGLEFAMWNNALANFVDHAPDTRATVSNYDVSLGYLPDMGFIHPKTKKEIGVRMAECSESLLYGGNGPTSVAQPKSYQVSGSDIYITFDKNVGSGLSSKSSLINGFSICAANGVYVPAEAEIVNKNTVRVWAKGVTAPVSAAYAYCTNNVNANLYSTKDNKLLMPVSPFFLKYIDSPHFWRDKEWLDCEEGNTFHNYGDTDGDALFYYTWSGADTSFSEDAAYSGDFGLQVLTTRKAFSVKPVLTFDDGDEDVPFAEIDTDYSDYGTMTFRISNGLPVSFRIESVDFYVGDTALETYYSPACTTTGKTGITVPENCPWVTITFDLNTLFKNGKTSGSTYNNSKLEDVREIKFNFSQSAGGAIVNLDEIRFTPENGNVGLGDTSGSPQLVLGKSQINSNYTPANMSSNMPDSFNELLNASLEAVEGTVTTIDNEKNVIYGLAEGLDTTTIMNYVEAVGSAKVTFSKDVIGTGTVITLTNTSTNEVVAEYTVVIFGDYNGDGIVDAEDTTYFASIANFEIFDYFDYEYLFMAADINGDGVVDIMDEESIGAVANFEAYIDQTITEGSKVVNY